VTHPKGDHPIEPPDRTSPTPSVYPPTSGPIDHVVTSGTFSLDGGTWDVDNNVWIVGDENEVIVIDAAHDVEQIALGIGGRRVVAVVCTHAHDDHVNRAPALSDRFNAPVLLNPAEAPLWEMTHTDRAPDRELADGDVLRAGGIELRVLLTPGHSPGSSCLYAPELGTVFTGDTLFQGGPARPAARSRRSTPSSSRSAPPCSPCPATPPSAPATATPPASAPKRRTWRSGSPAGTDVPVGASDQPTVLSAGQNGHHHGLVLMTARGVHSEARTLP